ncbi:MAG: hypothetical protein JHC33_15570 [Ignisphaera sp.]|nr:hypothetical protein [Ignisphaera sp.]
MHSNKYLNKVARFSEVDYETRKQVSRKNALGGMIIGSSAGGLAGLGVAHHEAKVFLKPYATRAESLGRILMGETGLGREYMKRSIPESRKIIAQSHVPIGVMAGLGLGIAGSIAKTHHDLKSMVEKKAATNNNVQQPPVAAPDHRALKTFAKLTAVGLAGTVIGGGLGARAGVALGKTGLGKKVLAKGARFGEAMNSKLGGHVSGPGAVAGAMIGAHAAGGIGDLLTLHHDFKQSDAQQVKQASYNKYLAKIVK